MLLAVRAGVERCVKQSLQVDGIVDEKQVVRNWKVDFMMIVVLCELLLPIWMINLQG